MADIYLDRDNSIVLRLKQDGSVVAEDRVTRAVFWLPASASGAGTEVVFDTASDSDITLTDSATTVTIEGGDRDLNTGRYLGYLTIYDSTNPDGLAWGTVEVNVKNWNPTS